MLPQQHEFPIEYTLLDNSVWSSLLQQVGCSYSLFHPLAALSAASRGSIRLFAQLISLSVKCLPRPILLLMRYLPTHLPPQQTVEFPTDNTLLDYCAWASLLEVAGGMLDTCHVRDAFACCLLGCKSMFVWSCCVCSLEMEARRARLRAATVHAWPKFNPDQDCKVRAAIPTFPCAYDAQISCITPRFIVIVPRICHIMWRK